MTFESIFATACVLIMILILEGIVFYFKGYENGVKETAKELYDIIDRIQEQPTADVEEVRHGEWVEQIRDCGEYMETEGFKCSVCGYETMDNDKKYCTECGAKMDGGREE